MYEIVLGALFLFMAGSWTGFVVGDRCTEHRVRQNQKSTYHPTNISSSQGYADRGNLVFY